MASPIAHGVRARSLGRERPDPPGAGGHEFLVGLGVAAVVSAQVASQANGVPGVRSGALLVLLQASGPVFVAVLTVLLLGACRQLRGWTAARFWLACLAASVLVYVGWSAIYFLADGGWPRPLPAAGGQFAHDLLTGSARPQLGFVFVAVQLCAAMPLLRWVIRITRGAHRRVFVVTLVLQLAVSASAHWLPAGGIAPAWVTDPARLLPAYVLFVVAGALLVDHREELGLWMVAHLGAGVAWVAAGVAVTEASYGFDIAWRHLTPARAAQSVQPAVTIAGLAALTALYAAAAVWEARRRPGWQARLVSGWSEGATGVYLVAPLLVQAALATVYIFGLVGPLQRLFPTAAVVLGLGCGVPLLLAMSWLLTAGLRRTPLSAVLTGRPRLRATARVGSARIALNARIGMTGLGLLLAIALGAQVPALAPARVRPATAPSPPSVAETITAAAPAAPATVATLHTITVGGLPRTYEVIQPLRRTPTELPVFVFLHGIEAAITVEEERDGLLPLVSTAQAILVYPAGVDEAWNDGACCSVPATEGVDDVAFLTEVVHASEGIPGADPTRVYVVGYSDGGKMAYDLICRQPHLVTGAVVLAAIAAAACPPGAPVPLLEVAADNDPLNRYQDVLRQVGDWVARDGCATSSSTATYGTLTLQSWTACARGSRVEFATYAGAGHAPFGGAGSPPLAQLTMSFVEHAPLES